jgi:hypothetical protein
MISGSQLVMFQRYSLELPLIFFVLANSKPDILAFLTSMVSKIRWDDSSQMPLLRVRSFATFLLSES